MSEHRPSPRPPHGRTESRQSAVHGRIGTLARLPPDCLRLVRDMTDQFDRIRSLADGEREYLQGVIEFYQTTLTLDAMLVGQVKN